MTYSERMDMPTGPVRVITQDGREYVGHIRRAEVRWDEVDVSRSGLLGADADTFRTATSGQEHIAMELEVRPA